MKKMIAVILLFAICVTVSGCKNKADDYIKTVYTVVNNLEGVTFEIKEGTLSNHGLTVTVKNNSKNEYMFGEFSAVEKNIDGEWYQVPVTLKENYGWSLIGYPIQANSEREFEDDWEWLYGKLDSGKYRFIKNCHYSKSPEDTEQYYLSAEFVIE